MAISSPYSEIFVKYNLYQIRWAYPGLYYSCFYAVTALLVRDNLSSPKHTGVRSLFNKNYIRSEIISKDFGAVYNELFEYCLEADYTDFADFDELQVLPFIAKVRDF